MKRPLHHIVLLVPIALLAACSNAGSEDAAAPPPSESEVTSGNAPITLQNFETHSKIVEVKKIVDAVAEAARKPTAQKQKKDNLCENVGEPSREKVTVQGKIRKLVFVGGHEEHMETTEHYYDDNGKLRFAFDSFFGIYGYAREIRVFFDKDGNRFFEVWRQAQAEEGAPEGTRPSLDGSPWLLRGEETFDLLPNVDTQPGQVFDSPPTCF